MKNRIRFILIVGLLIALFVSSTAFAATNVTYTSKATMNYGITSMTYGGEQTLTSAQLNGYVHSELTSTGQYNERLRGRMRTQGIIFTHTRDSVEVSPGNSSYLYWSNPNGETGTFWSDAYAPYGNHDGYCSVWQNH